MMLRKLTIDDIADLRTASADYEETERLKDNLRRLRRERWPFALGIDDLLPIFHWKLRSQYGRVQRLLEENHDSVYRTITRATFEIREDGSDYEAKVRLALLCTLSGVSVPVASAILALVDPDHYCVIDFRGWRAIFGGVQKNEGFTINEYLRYRKAIAELAGQLSWSIQETDLAVWVYDIRNS